MTLGARPREATVRSSGLALHCLEWGDSDAPSMLLLHGTSSHAHIWDRFAAAFERGFRIVALDQRGFGDSEWPSDFRTGYRPECWQGDVAAVISELRLSPVTLLGLSAGGNTAIHYAAERPDDVRRLVIVEMGPEVGRAGVARVIQSIPAREEFDTEEDAIRHLAGSGGRTDPVLARAHAIHSLKPLASGRVGLKGDPALRRRDWRRPLRSVDENWSAVQRIRCPVLLVRGGESKFLRAETAERMQREMKDCTLVTIPGAGHTVPLHRPAEFEQAVRDWLR